MTILIDDKGWRKREFIDGEGPNDKATFKSSMSVC